MNVYDFDKTIYNGDSTVDFYFFCMRRHIAVFKALPRTIYWGARFKLGFTEKTAFKEKFYTFLACLDDVDKDISDFWEEKFSNIMPWYLNQKNEDDVIISASPEFLLAPAAKRLGVFLIASRVDKKSGKYTGINCWGREKVCRFKEVFPDGRIENTYSDSLSDSPLGSVSDKFHLVDNKRGTIT